MSKCDFHRGSDLAYAKVFQTVKDQLTAGILRMLEEMLTVTGSLGEELEMVHVHGSCLALTALQEDLGTLPLRQRHAAVKQKLDLWESVRS